MTKITSKLGDILTYAKDNGIDPIVDFVLLELEKNREYEQRSNRINMFDTLELYIEEKKDKVSVDQIKDYKSLKKHLTNFKEHSSQPVTFRNLNLKFYNELPFLQGGETGRNNRLPDELRRKGYPTIEGVR